MVGSMWIFGSPLMIMHTSLFRYNIKHGTLFGEYVNPPNGPLHSAELATLHSLT